MSGYETPSLFQSYAGLKPLDKACEEERRRNNRECAATATNHKHTDCCVNESHADLELFLFLVLKFNFDLQQIETLTHNK